MEVNGSRYASSLKPVAVIEVDGSLWKVVEVGGSIYNRWKSMQVGGSRMEARGSLDSQWKSVEVE